MATSAPAPPRRWGRTSAATGSPHVASLTQSALALVVILVYALAGWDPLVTLFYRGGTSGGLGVLLLIAATSIAVVVYFVRHPSGERVWRRRIAPIAAILTLGVVVALALDNVDVLLGVPADHALVWAVPVAFAVAAALGFGWGLILRTAQPQVYAGIGLGAKAALASMPSAPVPNPRHSTTSAPDPTAAQELWR